MPDRLSRKVRGEALLCWGVAELLRLDLEMPLLEAGGILQSPPGLRELGTRWRSLVETMNLSLLGRAGELSSCGV